MQQVWRKIEGDDVVLLAVYFKGVQQVTLIAICGYAGGRWKHIRGHWNCREERSDRRNVGAVELVFVRKRLERLFCLSSNLRQRLQDSKKKQRITCLIS